MFAIKTAYEMKFDGSIFFVAWILIRMMFQRQSSIASLDGSLVRVMTDLKNLVVVICDLFVRHISMDLSITLFLQSPRCEIRDDCFARSSILENEVQTVWNWPVQSRSYFAED